MTGGTFGLAWPWVLLALSLPWILQRLLPPARPAGTGHCPASNVKNA